MIIFNAVLHLIPNRISEPLRDLCQRKHPREAFAINLWWFFDRMNQLPEASLPPYPGVDRMDKLPEASPPLHIMESIRTVVHDDLKGASP